MKKLYTAAAFISLYTFVLAQKHQKILNKNDSIRSRDIETIVIVGPKSGQPKLLQLNRNYLDDIQGNNLGETLSKIPGIQNFSFGANSGTPMIRSLSGNRVKLLNNGLSMNDLSGISPDLNVDYDPENVKIMQIYKGSAAVKYGGKAIGGAVNIISGTIPAAHFDKKVSAQAKLEGSSNNGFRQNISTEGNLGKNFAWHAGAMNETRDIIRIHGNTKSDLCFNPKVVGFDSVMQALCQVNVNSEHVLNITIFPYLSKFALDHLNDPAYGLSANDIYTFEPKYYSSSDFSYHDNLPNPKYVPGQDPVKDRYTDVISSIKDMKPVKKGEMPNSHFERRSVNAGISFIKDNFHIGVGYQGDDTYFGVPAFAQYSVPKHSHDAPVKQPEWVPINVAVASHRAMMESGVAMNKGFIQNIILNYDAQFSENTEYLDTKVANRFNVVQHSARLDANQKSLSFLSGTSGAEWDQRQMHGSGRLRYLPNNLSRELGIYTAQNLHFKFAEADLGYRRDFVLRNSLADESYKPGRGLAGGKLSKQNYNLDQYSASLKLNILKAGYVVGKYNHSERAPEVNELYAGNRHLAIITEENGDNDLKKEIANTWEVGGGITLKNFRASVNYYETKYKNYIYLAHTGIIRDWFVVKEWRNADTELKGWEGEAAYRIIISAKANLDISGFYDIVRNINVSSTEMRKWAEGDYMPNMPVSRVGFGLAGNMGTFKFNSRLDMYLKQKYLGNNINQEIAMSPYSLLSCRISYVGKIGNFHNEYYIFGTNLLNVAGRPQNSPLKYIVPLPGVNIGVGTIIKI